MLPAQSSIHELESQVTSAIQNYLDVVGTDHHKHRDGEFEIIRTWDGWNGGPPKWHVYHPGYINELPYTVCETYRAAMEFLIVTLKEWTKELDEHYRSGQ